MQKTNKADKVTTRQTTRKSWKVSVVSILWDVAMVRKFVNRNENVS